MPFLQRQIKRALIIIGARLQIGLMRQQYFHDFPVAILRRSV